MDAQHDAPTQGGFRWTVAAIVLIAGVLACFVTIGADCLWLVALGDQIREDGKIPRGVPFAASDTSAWPNVPVLAEVTLSLVHGLGLPALAILQVLASTVAIAVMALDARAAGSTDAAIARTLPVFAAGAVTGLAVMRLQVFSLVLFALLLWLLREQHRRASRGVWALPVLVATWSNFHGAVLLGVAVSGAYLLFSRLSRRTAETVVVAVLTVLAVLATPVGLSTIRYYTGVLGNEAARQHTGLWAPLRFDNPFDVIFIVAAAWLVVQAARRNLPLWEWVVLVGLTIATIGAARNGLWLVMWAVTPAAAPRPPSRARTEQSTGRLRAVGLALAVSTATVAAVILYRGEAGVDPDARAARAIAEAAGDRVVLAPEPLAESLAVNGARLWVLNPVDAFDAADQRAYLAYLDGDPSVALLHVDVAVAAEGSSMARMIDRTPGFSLLDTEGGWAVFARP